MEISSVQFTSVAQACLTLCDPMDCNTQAFPVIISSWSLLKLMSIESVMPSNHLILWSPLLFLPSIFPSIRVFSKESVLRMRWPKYWSFRFSISPSNEYSGQISFRMEIGSPSKYKGLPRVFSNTTVQGIKSSLLSFLYSPTLIYIHMIEKNIALTRWNFVGKKCLCF